MEEETYKVYPHNPPHLFINGSVYMVTGATLSKAPILKTDRHKSSFCDTLFERAKVRGWELQAWVVLDNHYHFIAQSPENAKSLVRLIRELHSITAIGFNQLDDIAGRTVWYNYWDSCINYETSFLARLNYIHQNPIKHGMVEKAEDYPFCSYRWFITKGDSELQRKVREQPIDRVHVEDNF
jgi:putative transposase